MIIGSTRITALELKDHYFLYRIRQSTFGVERLLLAETSHSPECILNG